MQSHRNLDTILRRRPDERARPVRLGFAALFAGLACGGIWLGIWVIVKVYSPVPFADFWAEFPFIERAVGGDLRIEDLWRQANEHRILVPRLQFVLDYWVFDGTNVFLFGMIAASCLALAGVLAAVVWLETADWLLTWGAFCAAAIAALSPVNIENLYWAFQVSFVQVFLFAVVAVMAVVVATRSSTDRGRNAWAALSALAAIASTYSMANGLLVWPVLISLALLGLGKRGTAALATVGAVTVLTYLWHFEFTTGGSLSDPVGLVEYVTVYLGSGLRDGGTRIAGSAGAVGLTLFAVLCRSAWKRRGASVAAPAGTGIALFVLLTTAQTASGRLDFGIAQALSSRYAIGSFTFWLALLIGFVPSLRERLRGRTALLLPLYFLGAAVLALAIAVNGKPSGAWLHSLAAGSEITVAAYRVGVDDPGGTRTGGPSGAIVANTFGWMREHRLGPWAPGGMVDGMRFTFPSTSGSSRCGGHVESVEPVTGGWRLRGWLAAHPGDDASRDLAVLDAGDVPRGLGRTGSYRPDVRAAELATTDWTGFVAYARGRPPPPLQIVLVASDRRSPVCSLEASYGSPSP